MKTIGLLGGMSWESTVDYYRAINQGIRQTMGGLHSAKIALYSVDFAPIEQLQHAGDWDGTAEILTDAALRVQRAGADFLLLCTNTMHMVAPQIEAAVDIPLLHIADATAKQLVREGISKVGLLGTAFTMEQEFYRGRLQERHGISALVPEVDDRRMVHDIIYRELCVGDIRDESRRKYLGVIGTLREQGAEAVILGCTEIGMLVCQEDTDTRLFDTTAIHAQQAVEFALRNS